MSVQSVSELFQSDPSSAFCFLSFEVKSQMSEQKGATERSLRTLNDVFLLVDQACLNTKDLSEEKKKELAEINDKIKLYQQLFKKLCDDQPSKKQHHNFSFDDMVPRFSKLVRNFILTHQWAQAIQWVHALTMEVQNTSDTIWKAGLACLIQNGNQHLIQTYVRQLHRLKDVTCVEVLLDYLLHLISLGELPAAKELIIDLQHSETHSQNVLSNKRRQEAHTLFHAYQGLVLYLEWKASLKMFTEEEKYNDKSNEQNSVSSRLIANRALEYMSIVKDIPGVWDIFIFKMIMIHEHYGALDEARALLHSYRENNPRNPNALRYLYEFETKHDGNHKVILQYLKDLVSLDPCSLYAVTLLKMLAMSDSEQIFTEMVPVFFNFLDFDHCKDDPMVWKFFAAFLTKIKE